MKNTVLLAFASVSLALVPLSSQAGGGKYVVSDSPVRVSPDSSPCYGGGFEFGSYVAGYFPQGGHYDDALGGGISLAHYFNSRFGLDFGAVWFDTDSAIHHYTLDAVYRIPFDCVAPYILAGGGVHTNGETEGIFRFGGGVDFRVFNSTSLFADGVYTIADGDVADSATVRLGLRFAF